MFTCAPSVARPLATDRQFVGCFLASIVALAVLAACGDAGTDPDEDTGAPDTVVDSSSDSSTDTERDTAVPDVEPMPSFVIGTNEVGANSPSFFEPLADGDSLEIEFGFQGLWMTVLAFQTRDIFDGPVGVDAWITVNDIEQGRLTLIDQTLVPGGDGFDYYYNFFLVVSDPSVAGETGVIHFEAESMADSDIARTVELTVSLTGGE